MATVTEDVAEGLGLAAALSASEYTTRLCAHLGLEDVSGATLVWDVEVVFSLDVGVPETSVGFNASESLGLAAVAANTVATTQNVVDGMGMGEPLVAPGQGLNAAEGVALEDVSAFAVDTNAVEGVGLQAVAAPVKVMAATVEESVGLQDEVEQGFTVDVEEGIGLGTAQSFEIDISVTETTGLAATAAAYALVEKVAAEGIGLAAVATQQLSAMQNASIGIGLRARPLVLDATAPALWANSERMALALWRQTPYESFAMHRGRLFAAGADGIYMFGFEDDDETPVLAKVKGDLTDLGSDNKKTFDAALLSGKTGGPLRVTVETEMGAYSYDTHLPDATYPKTHRAPVGRGLTGRYVRFTVDNESVGSEGASFSLDKATIGVADSGRVR